MFSSGIKGSLFDKMDIESFQDPFQSVGFKEPNQNQSEKAFITNQNGDLLSELFDNIQQPISQVIIQDLSQNENLIRSISFQSQSLGSGSYGDVLLLRVSIDKYTALKIISKNIVENLKEILFEVHIMNIFKTHKIVGVPKLSDAYISRKDGKALDKNQFLQLAQTKAQNDDYKLIIEMSDCNCTLSDLLATRSSKQIPYSESEVAFISLQLLNALQNTQRIGIFNGDIKPDNVLFDNENDQYLISDWGLAEIRYGPPYHSLQPRGTPCFMAPEISGLFDLSLIDIYSMGKLILLLMVPNYQRQSQLQSTQDLIKLIRQENKFNNLLPLIEQMVQSNPLERITLESLITLIPQVLANNNIEIKSPDDIQFIKVYGLKLEGEQSKLVREMPKKRFILQTPNEQKQEIQAMIQLQKIQQTLKSLPKEQQSKRPQVQHQFTSKSHIDNVDNDLGLEYLHEANKCKKIGRLQQACQLFQKSIQVDPTLHSLVMEQMPEVYEDGGYYSDALAIYNQTQVGSLDYHLVSLKMARCLFQIGSIQKALELVKKFLIKFYESDSLDCGNYNLGFEYMLIILQYQFLSGRTPIKGFDEGRKVSRGDRDGIFQLRVSQIYIDYLLLRGEYNQAKQYLESQYIQIQQMFNDESGFIFKGDLCLQGFVLSQLIGDYGRALNFQKEGLQMYTGETKANLSETSLKVKILLGQDEYYIVKEIRNNQSTQSPLQKIDQTPINIEKQIQDFQQDEQYSPLQKQTVQEAQNNISHILSIQGFDNQMEAFLKMVSNDLDQL